MLINVHIDQLILEGLPLTQTQGGLVQAAVEAELTRLLAQRGLALSLQTGGMLPNVYTDRMQLKADSTPTQVGQQIAQSVYGGIGEAK
jgi:hypothetical protein